MTVLKVTVKSRDHSKQRITLLLSDAHDIRYYISDRPWQPDGDEAWTEKETDLLKY